MKILDMNDPDFTKKLMEEIEAKPGDEIVLRTSQFKRVDGITPADPAEVFNNLHQKSRDELLALGLVDWDGQLWLLPYEWFGSIPICYPLISILKETSHFHPDTHDDDHRYGMLPYGIIPDFAKKSTPQN